MEMNPFKPLIQFYESLYETKILTKKLLNKLYLKINIVRAIS